MPNTQKNRIKIMLVEQQKTSRWLAEAMGKSEVTVSRWVCNRTQPSLDQLINIARLLDIDVRELITTTKTTNG